MHALTVTDAPTFHAPTKRFAFTAYHPDRTLRVFAWRDLAVELSSAGIIIGDRVDVTGDIEAQRWTTAEGEAREQFVITAAAVEVLDDAEQARRATWEGYVDDGR
jgi:single-stranded DNA-binding protein